LIFSASSLPQKISHPPTSPLLPPTLFCTHRTREPLEREREQNHCWSTSGSRASMFEARARAKLVCLKLEREQN
jgi:hypothetical protein